MYKDKDADSERLGEDVVPVPVMKQNSMNMKGSIKHVINIVPIHTPVSSPESVGDIHSEERRAMNNFSIEKSNHNKIQSSGNVVSMGREVIILNNCEAKISERVVLPADNISPNSSSKNSTSAQHSKRAKVRNISMNLCIEQTQPQISALEISKYHLNTNPARISTKEFETRIQALLVNNRYNAEHIQEINGCFEEFTDNFSELSSSKGVRSQQEILRKIKLAYEIFFQNYIKNEQTQLRKVMAEKNELLAENKKLKQDLKDYRDELQVLRQHPVSKGFDSALETQAINKKNSIDQMDTPPITKNVLDVDLERETLRSIITSQQKTINSLKKKEFNIAKILATCKTHGIDIESICNEDLKAALENAESNHNNPAEESDLPTLNKHAHLPKSQLRTKNNSIHKSEKTDEEEMNLHSVQNSSMQEDSGSYTLVLQAH